ncbi:putative extensin [Iris pallida]|uniref:Extensin n=1 Tax=Iris pallida TaxID=29817 RepID=A0AAX6H6J5_IRIPA|nr:putative extensin [Iris pallida]KAJ6836354.1 putative extensin [Iris pallida]
MPKCSGEFGFFLFLFFSDGDGGGRIGGGSGFGVRRGRGAGNGLLWPELFSSSGVVVVFLWWRWWVLTSAGVLLMVTGAATIHDGGRGVGHGVGDDDVCRWMVVGFCGGPIGVAGEQGYGGTGGSSAGEWRRCGMVGLWRCCH